MEQTLQCHSINLHLTWVSDVHETDAYEELNLLRKIVPQEPSATPVLKFIFWNNPSECIPMFSLPRRLLAPVRVVSAERSFSKLKMRQNYCDLVFAKNGQSHFQLYWLKTKLVKE